jgi:hypothetical protein
MLPHSTQRGGGLPVVNLFNNFDTHAMLHRLFFLQTKQDFLAFNSKIESCQHKPFL